MARRTSAPCGPFLTAAWMAACSPGSDLGPSPQLPALGGPGCPVDLSGVQVDSGGPDFPASERLVDGGIAGIHIWSSWFVLTVSGGIPPSDDTDWISWNFQLRVHRTADGVLLGERVGTPGSPGPLFGADMDHPGGWSGIVVPMFAYSGGFPATVEQLPSAAGQRIDIDLELTSIDHPECSASWRRSSLELVESAGFSSPEGQRLVFNVDFQSFLVDLNDQNSGQNGGHDGDTAAGGPTDSGP